MSDRLPRLLAGALLVGVSLLTLACGLPNDVRYEIGTKAVSPAGPAGTFTHRPLLFRLISSALVAPADLLTDRMHAFEVMVRGEAVLLAMVAALLLGAGLRRHRPSLGPSLAAPVAVAVFGAEVLMDPAFTLEPEWLATVLTVAGVGAGLLLRRRLLSAVPAGVLLAAAAAVKVVSLPIAIIGLLALLLLDRRRAAWVAGVAVISGAAYLAGLARWASWEIGWLLDMRTVQPLPRPAGELLAVMIEYAENVAVMWPVLALVPAALVGTGWRLRLAVAAALVLAWLPAQLQQHFYAYHGAALPVVAAAVVAPALRRSEPVPAVALVAISGWTAWLMTTPPAWRENRPAAWFVVVAVFGALAWWWRRRTLRAAGPVQPAAERTGRHPVRPGAVAGVLTGLLVAVTFVPMSTPTAAESLSLPASGDRTERDRDQAARNNTHAAARIHARIGERVPVTYLTFGDISYFVGNPTTCRYPSPVFLQRSRQQHNQEHTRSWRENLDCLKNPGRWLIWDTRWFSTEGEPAIVLDTIRHNFDCDAGFRTGRLLVCPRR